MRTQGRAGECSARVRTTTARRLQPTLDAQQGLITTGQLAGIGLDVRLPRREGWRELAPSTWSTSTAAPSDAQLVRATQLYAGSASVVSGPLACRLHGLRDVPASAVADVLVPHGRRLQGGGDVVVHQTSRLPRPASRRGVRVAPAPRAVADAARWCGDLSSVRALVLAALSDVFVHAGQLQAEVDSGPTGGSRVLRRSLRDWRLGARSAPEAEAADALRALVRSRQLPPFLLNPQLWLDGRLLGVPDGYVPGLGIGWEVDSLRHHGSSRDLARTLARHDLFAQAGVVLIHVVPAALRREPAAWARSFADRVAQRSAQRASDPPGLVVRSVIVSG